MVFLGDIFITLRPIDILLHLCYTEAVTQLYADYDHISRRVFFEKLQHNGDCSVNGRFANTISHKPPVLTVTNFQEEKQ